MSACQPLHQVARLRPLAGALYDSTRSSTAPISHARDELGLFLSTLDATETCIVLCSADCASLPLEKTLSACHRVLEDLQAIHQNPVGDANPSLAEIKARFSSLLFELCRMNVDMSISSQNNVDRSIRSFIDDVHAARQDPLPVKNVLSSSVPSITQEEAWADIQKKLEELGVPPELSTKDRNYIIPALQKAVDEEHILRDDQSPSQPAPVISSEASSQPGAGNEQAQPVQSQDSPAQSQNASIPDYCREDFGLSDKMPIPRIKSRANVMRKPLDGAENLPIPLANDPRGTSDSEKQVVTASREDFPIPVSATFSPVEDADKEVIPYESFSTLAGGESSSGARSADARSTSHSDGSSSLPSPVLTTPTSRCPSNRSSKSTKRPSIMSRMKFKFSTSKEEFISLIQSGNYVSVKTALEKGADADTMNISGQTALMVSCSYGHESLVQLLLEYGAHFNKMSNKGDTALTVAASRGFEGIVRLLLGRGAVIDGSKNIGKTALSTAAGNGHENMVRILFNSGADINALCHTGDTALSQAADNGHEDITRFLLDNGAYVDLTAYPRKTPLYKAVAQGHTSIARLLLERGADPSCADSIRGQSPLMIAALYRRTEIIYLLQQLGYQVPHSLSLSDCDPFWLERVIPMSRSS